MYFLLFGDVERRWKLHCRVIGVFSQAAKEENLRRRLNESRVTGESHLILMAVLYGFSVSVTDMWGSFS